MTGCDMSGRGAWVGDWVYMGGGYCQELRRLLYSHGLARRGRKVTGCDMSGRGAWVGDWVYIWVLGGGGRGVLPRIEKIVILTWIG